MTMSADHDTPTRDRARWPRLSFLTGLLGSATGATLGTVLWCGVAAGTDRFLDWFAWGVGFLAGLGMYLGYRRQNEAAGLAAAGMSIGGILLGKLVIYVVVVRPFPTEPADVDEQRRVVARLLAEEILRQRNVRPERATIHERFRAGQQAVQLVLHMDEDEVRRQYDRLGGAAAWEAFQRRSRLALPEPEPKPTFYETFGVYEGIFILLAFFTAYKVGCGKWARGE